MRFRTYRCRKDRSIGAIQRAFACTSGWKLLSIRSSEISRDSDRRNLAGEIATVRLTRSDPILDPGC